MYGSLEIDYTLSGNKPFGVKFGYSFLLKGNLVDN